MDNPPAGSDLAAAKEFGVDLTLLISALRRDADRACSRSLRKLKIVDIAKQLHPELHPVK